MGTKGKDTKLSDKTAASVKQIKGASKHNHKKPKEVTPAQRAKALEEHAKEHGKSKE